MVPAVFAHEAVWCDMMNKEMKNSAAEVGRNEWTVPYLIHVDH